MIYEPLFMLLFCCGSCLLGFVLGSIMKGDDK